MSGLFSELHPGGFGHVPIALMKDPRHRAIHSAVYGAVASIIDFKAVEGLARILRIAERAGCSEKPARLALNDLVAWGYIYRERTNGGNYHYTLLPTDDVDVLDDDVEDATLSDPRLTGREGGRASHPKP